MKFDLDTLPARILHPHMTRAEALARVSTYVDPEDIDTIVSESEFAIRPDGSHVYTLLRNVVPYELAIEAYPIALRASRNHSVIGGTRFSAAGVKPQLRVRLDGSIGNRTEVPDLPHLRGATEGLLGAYEKPECRLSSITTDNWSEFSRLLPLSQHLNSIFRQFCPQHFALQDEAAGQIDPSFLLEGTVFSTVTCNRNWRTALHIDKGDLRVGRGVLTMLSRGAFSGGELALPHYRVAVRYGMLDVLIMDNHEVHGNLPLVGNQEDFTRLALIYYLRTNLLTRCPAL